MNSYLKAMHMIAAVSPTKQVPGIYHHSLGDLTITAVNDGYLPFSFGYATHMEPLEASKLYAASFRTDPPRVTVNAFAVHTPEGVVLIDSGCGGALGDTLGTIPANLAAAGINPSDVTTILMTHLHLDHVGGLIDAAGNARYPNAELVMHTDEAAFWLSPDALAKASESVKSSVEMAQKATAPYQARLRTLSSGEALPGFAIVPEPGHTPGHSGWMINSGGQKLLIWGDIAHLPSLQFANPHIGVAFDTDGKQAYDTRLKILDMAASERLLVAGMHLDFPPFGHVRKQDQAYAFVPLVWSPAL